MKKKELSPSELNKVVELRQLGANWSEIQDETGVERRAAKRVYEEWERDKKMKEQEAARFRVAAEAFHEHLNHLIRLAEALINYLSLPSGPDDARSAEQLLSTLWRTSILEESKPDAIFPDDRARQIRANERLNLMIFKSLQTHTREKLRWQVLDEWKKAWDSCRELFDNLKMKGWDEVTYILDKESDLLQEIEKRSEKEDAIQGMARAMVYAIWESVVENKFDSRCPEVNVSHELVDRRIGAIFNEKELKEDLISLCNDALKNLLANNLNLVEELSDQVHKLREAIGELAEKLNRLVLYPIILYTKCDLCPV